MTTQICNVCGLEKPLSEFPKNGVDKDGNTRRRPDCTVCYNIKRKLDKRKHNKFVNNTKHRTGEEDTYSLSDWKDALVHFVGSCAYCGHKQSRRIKLTKDHVVPVNGPHGGGKTVKNNIVPACPWCNSSKGDSKLSDWYPKQKFYSVERMVRIRQWQEE